MYSFGVIDGIFFVSVGDAEFCPIGYCTETRNSAYNREWQVKRWMDTFA